MQAYPNIVKLVSTEKKATDAGQISMFGEINKEIAIDIPKVKEFDPELKLKLEKDVVGIYLSGHPLSAYGDLFDQFSFNTSVLANQNINEEEDAPIADDDDAPDLNDRPVTFGAIVIDVKKILTKAQKQEMAILRVEDLYGTVEVMLFPKIYSKYKEIAKPDAVLKIAGKISIRDGEAPMILADDLKLLVDTVGNSGEEIRASAMSGKAGRRLYLKYNTKDPELHAEVQHILRAYSGDIGVAVKCTATNEWFAMKASVRECNAIKFELDALLGPDNLTFR